MGTVLKEEHLPQLLDILKIQSGSHKICGEIQARIDKVMPDFDFLVDSWPDVKAVVSRCNLKRPRFAFAKNRVTVFATDKQALKDLLRLEGSINWSRRLQFSCIQFDHSLIIQDVIREHNIPACTDENCVMMEITKDKLNTSPVPNGFTLTCLKSGQSEVINSQWQYGRGDASETYIRQMIKTRPSACLIDEDGNVAAYALVFHYGAIGLLNVEEKYKNLGLDRVVISALTEQCIKQGLNIFALLEWWNTSGITLHKEVGYETVNNSYVWITSNC